LIVLTIAFVVVLFSLKTSSTFKNKVPDTGLSGGLAYDKTIVKDLVNRDSDGDGMLDWEEGLWGTSPEKKDTNDDGVPDNVEIAKLKTELGQNQNEDVIQNEENLTQTDKFSRELIATMAALNQTGEMDQATIDKLGTSLALQIENSPTKKIYTLGEMKITNDNSVQAIQKYTANMDMLEKKYPMNGNATAVLQESLTLDGDIDGSVLYKLDPITQQMENIIKEMTKIEVPQKIASLHLGLTNAMQKIMENLRDIQLLDSDAIVALSAISQYEDNTTALEASVNNLRNATEKIE